MIDPRNRATFGHASAHNGHLDDVAAMMLADGERLPDAAAHVSACPACAARVAAFRSEADALAGSLALDPDETAFLQAAALPARVAAWAPLPMAGRAALARRWESPATMAAVVALAATGTFGWQLGSTLLAAGLDTASRAGATAVAADLAMGWIIALARLAWAALDAIARLPLIDSPALPLLALTASLWVLLVLMPRPAAAQTAAA